MATKPIHRTAVAGLTAVAVLATLLAVVLLGAMLVALLVLGPRDITPVAVPGDCPREFDFGTRGVEPLGAPDLLRLEASKAAGAGRTVTLGELTRRAGWQDWDRMVSVPADTHAAALNRTVDAFDICWKNLPKSSYDWFSEMRWDDGYYLFFQGDTPRYAMRYVPSSTTFAFDDVNAVTYFPGTVLSPTPLRTNTFRLTPVS